MSSIEGILNSILCSQIYKLIKIKRFRCKVRFILGKKGLGDNPVVCRIKCLNESCTDNRPDTRTHFIALICFLEEGTHILVAIVALGRVNIGSANVVGEALDA